VLSPEQLAVVRNVLEGGKNMKKKVILVMQNWQKQLSHNIFYGMLDYLADSHRKDLQLCRIPWAIEDLHQQAPSYKVDGLIASVISEHVYKVVTETGWKCISTHIGISCPDMPQVDADHHQTGRMAAEYLLDQGFESFGYFGDASLHALCQRRDGFIDRLNEANIEPSIYDYRVIVQSPITQTVSIEKWLKERPFPTAIFCSDDTAATDLNMYCHQNDIQVPDQIAIVGCEDCGGLCRSAHPPLSSVHLPYRKIGYEAMTLMDKWLRSGKTPSLKTVLPPEYITPRASTDTLAIEDPQLCKAVRLLRDHCTEKITMSEIARQTGMSLRIMQSKFKKQIGHSPLAEFHKARIERVKQLLRETPFTLEEIADKTGYPNANYLCEHFKKMTSRSPGEYRRATQQISR
jgi:LacI family transcriptional regulator